MIWRDEKELDSFRRLFDVWNVLVDARAPVLVNLLAEALISRTTIDKWDPLQLTEFVHQFKMHFSLRHASYEEGLAILDYILDQLFQSKKLSTDDVAAIVKRKDSQIENKRIERSLGSITKAINELAKVSREIDDPRRIAAPAALLSGLAHIIRQSTKGEQERRRLERLAGANNAIAREYRSILVNQYMAIKNLGSDLRPDTFHVRNAFAHAHFEFIDDKYLIHIWDVDTRTGELTFDITVNSFEMLSLSNLFETKLAIAEIYIHIVIALRNLHHLYWREWEGLSSMLGITRMHYGE